MLVGKLQGRFPGSGISAYLESRTLILSGNETAALELAKAAAEKSSALPEARLWLGELLMRNGRGVQAENELKTVVSLSGGGMPKAYELLAELYH